MSYLETDNDLFFTAQVTRLLRDEETDNAALILGLIEGGGVNRRLLGYLFGLAVFHPDAEQAARALRLLRGSAGADTVKQAEKLRSGASYYYNEAEYLGRYENPEFDLFDFLLAYKMCHWHRAEGGRSHYFLISHQTLNLSHYPYPRLTPALETLDFIRYLALPAHKEFDLKASFPHLLQLPLETVFMENTRLAEFPVVLLQLPRLRTLSIKRGSYRPRHPMPVPEGGPYGNATLEKLVVESYPVSGEARLGDFPSLREASLVRCGLTTLDFLRGSTRLERLQVKHNFLESLPAFLANFTQLRILDLSFNPFRRIDLDLSRLEHLEELDIKVQKREF
jgi:hypothetical protein